MKTAILLWEEKRSVCLTESERLTLLLRFFFGKHWGGFRQKLFGLSCSDYLSTVWRWNLKVFCPLFFKKVGGILKGGSPLMDKNSTQICVRKFGIVFKEFKGVALKNPTRGFTPWPHELFEKSSTKTFNCHSWHLAKLKELPKIAMSDFACRKRLCLSLFFKKVADSKGGAFGQDFKGWQPFNRLNIQPKFAYANLGFSRGV